MSGEAIILLSLLLVAHYLGDFTPLATRQMQEAKAGFRPPGLIVAHAAVHGGLVFAAVGLVRPAWPVVLTAGGIEFATHLGIDFVKMKLGTRFPRLRDPKDGPFWYFLGLDQLAHLLILVAIAAWAL